MQANIRNVRGGQQIEKGGLIAYRLGKVGSPEHDIKEYLQPGDNLMDAARAKKILGSFHHQNVDHNGQPRGKAVTNGEAWQAAGWIDLRWGEPEWATSEDDESPVFDSPPAKRGK